MSAIEVQRLDSAEELLSVADEWDRLAAIAPDPFSTSTWVAAWWRSFAPRRDGEMLVARRGGEIVGGLPLVRRWGQASAMANPHTPVFRLVAADDGVRRAILAAVFERASAIRLPSVAADDPLLRTRGPWQPVTRPTAISPIVETTGSFDAWREESKKRWGAPLERFRRKMGRDHDLRLVVNEAPADLASELERGFAVEGSGWKGRAGTAILSHPETAAFYRDMAAGFHARGQLLCSSIELDGRMVAWDLSLLHDERVFLLKTGYDEAFRKLAPGLVLRLSVVEDCFERGYRAHELLGHVDDWKPKFATTERHHVEAHLFPRSAAGAAGLVSRRALHAAIPLVRRLRDRE